MDKLLKIFSVYILIFLFTQNSLPSFTSLFNLLSRVANCLTHISIQQSQHVNNNIEQ